jgi:hypothetical protein
MQMNMKSYRRALRSFADAVPSMSDVKEHLPEWKDVRGHLPEWSDVRERLPEMPEVSNRSVARGLGWVSIAIGLSEILAPKKIEQTMGIGNGQATGILRVLGLREICQGIDILAHDDPAPGLWARVAGDMLDGAVLAVAGTKAKKPGGFMAICMMVLPVVVLDMIYAKRCSAEKDCTG